jgi:hypothetical protein
MGCQLAGQPVCIERRALPTLLKPGDHLDGWQSAGAKGPSSLMFTRNYLDLFLVSFLALFMELACIRWFGSTVVFLTFFTNLVLLACFLGISVGCLAARSRHNFIGTVMPLLASTMVAAFALLYFYVQSKSVIVEVGSASSPEQLYFGTDGRTRDLSTFVVPLEIVAGTFFALISVSFIGIGQALGRAFNAISNHVAAYTVNLTGSLAGIAAFGALAYASVAPPFWFAIAAAFVLYFTRRPVQRLVSLLVAIPLVFGMLVSDATFGGGVAATRTVWSPYYKVFFDRTNGTLYVNNILHQAMADVERSAAPYGVPYLINQAAGGRPVGQRRCDRAARAGQARRRGRDRSDDLRDWSEVPPQTSRARPADERAHR